MVVKSKVYYTNDGEADEVEMNIEVSEGKLCHVTMQWNETLGSVKKENSQ